ncbi:MAG: hypothetical protein HY689_12770 [Chloroflexi bacterium]|nr:hypothetical protein [Chloroflexota bacterium]
MKERAEGQRTETSGPQSRVEVFLHPRHQSGWEVAVRLEAWSATLGWYPQKTLVLEPDQVGQLRRLLAAAEAQLRSVAQGPRDAEGAEVIPFPQVRPS